MKLEVADLAFVHRGRRVLDGVSFALDPGALVALIGPNGSGKSTLLKAVAGILPPTAGQIRLQGVSAAAQPLAWRAAKIAYLGADIRAEFPMTAFEAVLLGRSSGGSHSFLSLASAADLARIEETMRLCFCWDWRHRELASLSGGERQLVALARALAQGARILFLDEALSRMDLHHQAAVGRLLARLCREEGYAAMLVAHDLNLASEWATAALLLKDGRRVAYGPLRETLTEAALGVLYPGAPVAVTQGRVHFRS